jgi:ribosomal protein L12E/L44/L45/RPP1/RPP2
MLDRLDALGGKELEDLIGQSYDMVAAKAPKKKARKKKKPTPGKSVKKRKKTNLGRSRS